MQSLHTAPALPIRARHRWIVAVPLLLAVVALTLREGMDRPVGNLSAAPAFEIAADDGAAYELSDGAVILRAGGILVHAAGWTTVEAGAWTVRVWGGGAYIALQNGKPTVAAFDAPVLVAREGGLAVVPPSRQWTAPAGTLPDPAEDPVAWSEAVATKPLPAAFVARNRARIDAWSAVAVPAPPVPSLADADDAALAWHALADVPGRDLAAALRSRAALRAHALLQPSVRDAAWAYLPAESTVDAEAWAALLALPSLERDDAESSILTVRRWGDTLARAFDAADDPDARRAAVLPLLEAQVHDAAEAGYPVRALRFAEALRAAIGTGAVLDGAAASALLRLEAMTPDSLRASVLRNAAPVSTATAAPVVQRAEVAPDPALEARARDILASRGAMFTGETSVRTVAPGEVEVDGVVFGLPSGDRLLRFLYRPDADTVRGIAGGVAQPYEVPFRAYMDWEAAR